jgi:hypothetical protein
MINYLDKYFINPYHVREVKRKYKKMRINEA